MTNRRTAILGALLILVVTLAAGYRLVTKGYFVSADVAEAASSTDLTFAGQPTDRSPEEYQGSFLYTSSADMLSALGVKIYPEDKVYAFPEPGLGLGSHIEVYRAQPVMINDGNSQTLVRSWGATVGDVLKEQNVDIGEKDQVDPSQDAKIAVGDSPVVVTITRVAETQLVVKSSVDYETQYKDDATMDKGTQVVEQAGVNGTRAKTYLVRRENGVEVSRKLLDNSITKDPVAKIVRRGTHVVLYGTGGASWYGGVPAMTAAHLTLPKGTRVLVTNLANGKSVVVTIADRGPYVGGRVIDLSKDAFAQIASIGSGVVKVKIEKAD
ncbi:MAG: G5 domain-containing protein [bacterium]